MTAIKAATAAEICAHFNLQMRPKQLLREGMTPREFIEALLSNRYYGAAIDFLAYALAPREGIWWGCLCLQHACGDALAEPESSACRAAVQWVLRPGEESRAAAKAPAEAAGPATAGGSLARAANLTGGSLAPPNLPPVPPSPFDPAKAVAIAVKLAATKVEPAKAADAQRLFAELGMAVAEGRFLQYGDSR